MCHAASRRTPSAAEGKRDLAMGTTHTMTDFPALSHSVPRHPQQLFAAGDAGAHQALTILAHRHHASALGLGAQVGSIYQREMSSTWLALGAGALVPTLMSLLVLDVVLRNHGDRRKSRHSPTGVELDLPKRRKRRRRYRTL
jgi:hypothetical protein